MATLVTPFVLTSVQIALGGIQVTLVEKNPADPTAPARLIRVLPYTAATAALLANKVGSDVTETLEIAP